MTLQSSSVYLSMKQVNRTVVMSIRRVPVLWKYYIIPLRNLIINQLTDYVRIRDWHHITQYNLHSTEKLSKVIKKTIFSFTWPLSHPCIYLYFCVPFFMMDFELIIYSLVTNVKPYKGRPKECTNLVRLISKIFWKREKNYTD